MTDPALAERERPRGFFIVFSPSGEAPPKAIHYTHKAAFHAAHKLAEEHPDARFFVMQSKSRGIAHLSGDRGRDG